jgi:hypothetical protein
MELGFPATISLLIAGLALFLLALLRARRPADPSRVRMFDYTSLQFIAWVFILLMLSHLLTLIFGHPVTGRRP